MTDDYQNPTRPKWDADFQRQKAELRRELIQLIREYEPSVVIAALNEELSSQIQERAQNEFAEQWCAEDDQ